MLPEQAIHEFILIYEKNYGRKLSFEEATVKALSVFNFFKTIIKPEYYVKNLSEKKGGCTK